MSASLGMPLDEWQEQALEAAMGERSDGRWASKFVGISAPRQNGKSQLIVARALAGVLLFGEKMVIIAAHETDTAREVWKRLLDVVESNPTLEARVTGRMDAINREFLSFGKGSKKQTIKLKARRSSGVRGFSADCLLLDEAQILGKPAWGSIVPTMSAMPNPQAWLFGTPPTLYDDPFAFSRVRDSAMAHKARHAWLEWSADPGDDLDDPETWAKANPSFGVRISVEACADDRAAMDDEQFAMERLGMWRPNLSHEVFGAGNWEACGVDEGRSGIVDGLTFAVAATFEQSHGCIAAAGWSEAGLLHVEPVDHRRGTGWLPARAKELQDRHGGKVVVDGRGPAASLIPAMVDLEVDLVVAGTGDVLDACAGIYRKVQDGALRHLRYPELDAAVAGATQRSVGDRWAWGRKTGVDITPLESSTLAAWGVEELARTTEPPAPPPVAVASAARSETSMLANAGF